jgi:competence protein ComEA
MLKRIVATALAMAFVLSLTTGLAGAAAKPAPAGKVNINTASAEQLTTLPGVGPKLAARILDYRQKSGAFKSVQELMNVKNIDSCRSIAYM